MFRSCLISELDDLILYASAVSQNPRVPQQILLLDQQLELPDGSICIGQLDSFLALAAAQEPASSPAADQPVLFILSGTPAQTHQFPTGSWNLILVNLPLAPLYNRIQQTLSAYKDSLSAMHKYGMGSMQKLIQKTAVTVDSSICLLNPDYKIITASFHKEDAPLLRNSDHDTASLSPELIEQFLTCCSDSPFCQLDMEGKLFHYLIPIEQEGKPAGFLYGYTVRDPRELRRVLFPLANELYHLLDSPYGNGRTISFEEMAAQLFVQAPKDYEQIQLMIQHLSSPPEKYMRTILVRPDNLSGDMLSAALPPLARELRPHFPEGNLAVLEQEIVILISSRFAECPFPADNEKIERILEQHHATAVISHTALAPRSLRISYLKSQMILPVIMKVRLDPSRRVTYFGRYNLYLIVDICARHMTADLGTDDIIFLCSPAVLTLTRYDQFYNSDLRDVLFHYLMYDRNIAETAKNLFMHRNTVIYKINKIKELIHHSLDDPYYRFHLLFSCMLIRYYEEYQHHRLTLSPFIRDDYKS